MARLIVVVGDATSGGGYVITGSAFTDIDGRAVARVSDKATCPKHNGVFSIVTGDSTLMMDGQPVARDGDQLACGCSLFAGSQRLAYVEAAGAPAPSPEVSVAVNAIAVAVPAGIKPVICEECLRAGAMSGLAFLRR